MNSVSQRTRGVLLLHNTPSGMSCTQPAGPSHASQYPPPILIIKRMHLYPVTRLATPVNKTEQNKLEWRHRPSLILLQYNGFFSTLIAKSDR